MIYREAGQFKTSYAADQAVFPIVQDRVVVAAFLVVAFVLPPVLASEYWLQAVLIPFLVYAMAAVGLNLLTGYAGQVSLGTGGFMAVGAYTTFKLTSAFPRLSVLLAFLLAGLVTALVGLAFGLPSLRIKGFYLAVATLAAQFFLLWLFNKVDWFTDYASSGTITAPPRTVAGIMVTGPAATAPVLYLGGAETLAFDINVSFLVLFMVIIGGLGSILGSFLGAAFIVMVPIFLTNVPHLLGLALPVALQKQIELMVFGGLIILFLIVEPHGLARLWQITKEKLRLWPFPY